MFENLIDQPASRLLMEDIHSSRLPPSMLFSGDRASGKLTAALELARILSCSAGTALWTCTCPSCQRHKELTHSDLVIMGTRECAPEIRAAAAALVRSKNTAARYLFIRAIRKLVLRFDASLQDTEDSRFSKAASYLADIDERLEEFHPSRELPGDDEALAKAVEQLTTRAEKLEEECLYDSIPVSQVRQAAVWARLSPNGRCKVLIVENADRMQDSARNAFLKVLEEPPPHVVFVLTTSRRGAIMPTILSRVRTYAFVDRSLASQHDVIRRVFHDTPRDGEYLYSYFNRFLPVPPEILTQTTVLFVSGILNAAIDEGRKPLSSLRTALVAACALPQGESASPSEIVSRLNRCKPLAVWQLFLAGITRLMREALRSGEADAREITVFTAWTKTIREAQEAVETYNISPVSVLERLAESLKASL